ncbi:MAG: MFS transporter, partial [Pedobacter sp.]
MVGSLYKHGDSRRDAGFSLFYAGINIGALIGGYACITIGKEYSWHLAFGLAGVVMTISLLTFLFTQKSLGPIGLPPTKKETIKKVVADGIGESPQTEPAEITEKVKFKKWHDYSVYLGTLALIPVIMIMVAQTQYTDWFMSIIGPAALIYLFYEMTKHSVAEQKKLWAALVFIIFSIIFFAFFEQSGGSLSLFAARNLDNQLFGIFTLDPNGVNNSANSLFVIVFAFLFGLIWIALAKRKIEPNTVVKFGLGFLFLSGSFFILYSSRFFANADGITSLDI